MISQAVLVLLGFIFAMCGGPILYAFARFVLGMKTRQGTARVVLCAVWVLSLWAGDLATTLLPILLPKSPHRFHIKRDGHYKDYRDYAQNS